MVLQDLHEVSASLAHGENPSPFHSRKRRISWLTLIMVMDVVGSGVTSSFQSMPIRVKPILHSAFPVTAHGGRRGGNPFLISICLKSCHCWRQKMETAGWASHSQQQGTAYALLLSNCRKQGKSRHLQHLSHACGWPPCPGGLQQSSPRPQAGKGSGTCLSSPPCTSPGHQFH